MPRIRCIRCGGDKLTSLSPGAVFDPQGSIFGSMGEFLIVPGMPLNWNKCEDCDLEFLPERVQRFREISNNEIFVYLPEVWEKKEDQSQKMPVLYKKTADVIANEATNILTGERMCLDLKEQVLILNDLFNLFFEFDFF